MEKEVNSKISLNNLSQIRWACRRGMLELDLLLAPFADDAFSALSTSEQQAFLALLEYPDPILFSWLMGKEIPSDAELKHIVEKIKEHARAKF